MGIGGNRRGHGGQGSYIPGVTRRRPAPNVARALLGALAVALLWLAPAMGERHVPRGSVRARDPGHSAGIGALRGPERVEVSPRLVPVTPARQGAGASPFTAVHGVALRTRTTGAVASSPRVGSPRAIRPRRLVFPTEATAPPGALS